MGIGRNKRFAKVKVDILRPAFAVDVTTIRDRVLTNYVVIYTSKKMYKEPTHSEVIADRQVGGIEVGREVGFFDTGVNVEVNDILRESANQFNNNTITYFKVIGKLDYSRYGFPIRVDLDKMNYQRGQ